MANFLPYLQLNFLIIVLSLPWIWMIFREKGCLLFGS